MIPQDASVGATELEGSHLGQRHALYALKDDALDSEVFVYSQDGLGIGRSRDQVKEALRSGRYGLLIERGHLTALRRGADAAHNAWLLRRTEEHAQRRR